MNQQFKVDISPKIFNKRTLIVGLCFCGKTKLMMNRILSIEPNSPLRKIKI